MIGSPQTPNSSFADVWGKLAGHFTSNPGVIFGLMNEPHVQSAADWLVSANAAIAAIRSAGALQEILVPGTDWDGAWSWTLADTNNATVMGPGVVDPGHNFAFEVHQYLDSDSSGTHPGVVSPTIGVERLTAITQWAEANSHRLFLGEIGVDTQATSLAALDNTLNFIKQHTDVWQGVTYWAGGPWWGNYMFSIEPQNGVDKPQMAILMGRGADTATATHNFNGDGKSDILWQSDDGTPAVWLMDGTGATTASAAGSFNPGPTWHVKASADFDGDGKADILWQGNDGTAAMWLMDGPNATFAGAAGPFNPGPSWDIKGAGDFDGDGKADILWQGNDGTAAMWLMDGPNATFVGAAGAFNPGPSWEIKGTGDFDGDGKSDILWQGQDGTPAIWLMDGPNATFVGAAGPFNPGPSWEIKGTGDFDGDGKSDILWQSRMARRRFG